jgi:hypothetical protein
MQIGHEPEQPGDLVLGGAGARRAHDAASTAARRRATTSSRTDAGSST